MLSTLLAKYYRYSYSGIKLHDETLKMLNNIFSHFIIGGG